ncbi:hypothetical protein C7M61_003091 [Candidozyma pseudohaemuli]|uniref:Cyclin-D1-binding protein 1-like N-terminal domain-containing protein n=1 Tax=Candidozyma pseudohaemuli TaxID=418784 RepID=A0A2P7YPE9_9ASCO|nr:hypothetical protein C7M61_003091 [[Candida] pseudohaemulonii]PSK37846.1 hypothetical protein C7M61_003091 [[Candida] pseudohaemulonii]
MSDEKLAEKVLKPFKEALHFWLAMLNKPTELSTQIPAAQVEDPLREIIKLTKLIKAQTTKVGIVYAPKNILKQSDAVHDTVAELSKTFVFLISALSQLSPEKVSSLFYTEVAAKSKDLIETAEAFAEELELILKNTEEEDEEAQTNADTVNPRLLSVGKMWLLCDGIGEFIEKGNIKFLQLKTTLNISLIEDGLDEFEEWVKNPQDMDDDDPFGLDDDFSDEEAPADDKEADSGDEADNEDIIKFGELWLKQLKLVKLLFLSINKSLPSVTSGSVIDEIYATENSIVRCVDKLVVELMMNNELGDEVEQFDKEFGKSCSSIISILRSVNKTNETKVKWCVSWEAKYKELQDAKY